MPAPLGGRALSCGEPPSRRGDGSGALRYLSARFGIRRGALTRELLRAALRDTFAVIPSDPIPAELLPDVHDAGKDPAEFHWSDLDGVGDAMPVSRAGSS